MQQPLRRTLLITAALLLTVGCGEKRKDFDIVAGQAEIGEAFGLTTDDVSVFADTHMPDTDAKWLVDFRVPTFRRTLQARFDGTSGKWLLKDVRERPRSGQDAPWRPVGVLLGEVRREAADKTSDTVELMAELSEMIEALAVDSGNAYPRVDLTGLARLLRGRYTQEWRHDTDAWGNRLHYYASPDGGAYILMSRAADNRFDRATAEYEERASEGDFAFDGATDDPNLDIIIATGTFVQLYEPGE